VTVAAADEDDASAVLWEHGTQGIEVQPIPGGRVALLAYFADELTVDRLANGLAQLQDVHVEESDVPDVDWVARFREGFRAFSAGRFRIAPVWDPPERSADVLIVDPGRAFGTGTHETTRLCLAALESLALLGPLGAVADVGTGTGLLAVAAARLGASPVAAVDIDPEATVSARAHARLNEAAVHVVRGDGGRCFAADAFDLVLANLTTPLLLERCFELAALARPGGALVLAGALADDEPRLRASYSSLGPVEARTDGEWLGLVVRRSL
jgi:ribosomal protein L11 methyltransferase